MLCSFSALSANMKKLLRSILINVLSLWLTSVAVQGFSYDGGWQTLALAAVIFGVINLLIRPLVKLFLLPINLLTLGLLGWLVNVLMLYLLTLLVPKIKIEAFDFLGFTYKGLVVPALRISRFYCAVLASFLISTISGFLHWLAE